MWRSLAALMLISCVGGSATNSAATNNTAEVTENIYVTHYGYDYHGRRMGCGAIYNSYESPPTIVAVPYPSRSGEFPCGTPFEIRGPAGSIQVVRSDACPGCSYSTFDLSEAGVLAVCGGIHSCSATLVDPRKQPVGED